MAVRQFRTDEKSERRIVRLMKACGMDDETNLIRLALATMDILADHVNDGGRILLEGKDGSVRNFILLPGKEKS